MRLFSLMLVIAAAMPLWAEKYMVCERIRQDDAVAQRMIELILADEPGNTDCLIKLANIHLKKGDVTQGFKLIVDAYAMDPHNVQKKAVARILPSALKVTQLIDKGTKEKDFEAWNHVGKIFFEMGIFHEAVLAYEASLAIKPLQKEERIMFALSLENVGQTYRAAEELKKVLKLSANDFFANYYLAKILRHRIYDEVAARHYFGKAKDVLLSASHHFEEKELAKLSHDIEQELTVHN